MSLWGKCGKGGISPSIDPCVKSSQLDGGSSVHAGLPACAASGPTPTQHTHACPSLTPYEFQTPAIIRTHHWCHGPMSLLLILRGSTCTCLLWFVGRLGLGTTDSLEPASSSIALIDGGRSPCFPEPHTCTIVSAASIGRNDAAMVSVDRFEAHHDSDQSISRSIDQGASPRIARCLWPQMRCWVAKKRRGKRLNSFAEQVRVVLGPRGESAWACKVLEILSVQLFRIMNGA